MKQAIAELQTAIRLSGKAPTELMELGYIYAVSGRKAEAQKVVAQLNELLLRYPRGQPYLTALVFGGSYEKDQAFSLLEEAYRMRDSGMAL